MIFIKRYRRLRVLAICVVVLVLVLSAALYNGLTVTYYTIETPKVTASVRLALLTDLHSCYYGEGQSVLIKCIDDAAPDAILMSGDIVDDVLPRDGAIALLEGIANRYPIYYVTGNHELWDANAGGIKDMLRGFGVHVLEGERVVLETGGQRVAICGVDDPMAGREAFARQLENALKPADDTLYTILLQHRPERFEQLAYLDFDLMMSGHAHGGQWRIPFTDISAFAPNQGLFPRYTSGVHSMDGSSMLVSRGLAKESTGVPRMFNPPEVVVIELVPEGYGQ